MELQEKPHHINTLGIIILQLQSPYVRVSGLTTQTPDLGRRLSSKHAGCLALQPRHLTLVVDYLLNMLVSRFKF